MSYWVANIALTISESKKHVRKYRGDRIFETEQECLCDNFSLSFSSVFPVAQKQLFVVQDQD